MKSPTPNKKRFLSVHETVVFALLGALMFCSKILMEAFPNIHLLGMFTMVFALAYRKKGLIPLYVYVFINGVWAGFDLWWMPYLYIWTLLWGVTMLLPKRMPLKVGIFVYPVVCAMHGMLFGILYSPAQALMFGLGWKQLLAWIAAGFPFDALHAIGDLAAGLLIVPLWRLISKIDKSAYAPNGYPTKTSFLREPR